MDLVQFAIILIVQLKILFGILKMVVWLKKNI
jgi:hypothetical protein